MVESKKYTMRLKRKRKGLTNYKKRLTFLKSKENRLVIRKSLNNLSLQIVQFHEDGDKVLITITTKDLAKKFGWKANRGNIPSAYLAGFLMGITAKKNKIDKAIADFGLQCTGLRLYAALKGVIDGGINIPCSKEILPSDDFIKGNVIANYAQGKTFSRYIKNNLKPEDLEKHFEETKKRIKDNA